MPDTSAGYILLREGEQPDPTKELPFQQAAAAFLKGVAADPLLKLHDLATGLSYSAADSDVVRMVYFSHLRPPDLEVRSADGQTRKPVQNVQDTLQELARNKAGGLFVPAEDLWLVAPPESNPDFEQQVELLQRESPEMKADAPSTGAHLSGPAASVPESSLYPVETRDDMDLLPGLSGDRMLNATINFVRQANPATLAVLGALAGVLAYKSMGLKGVVGLLLAIAALKRYIKMGNRIILDQRLDLAARGIQEGVPVNKDGQIDPEFLEALRHFPVGDNNVALRRVSPTVKAREWGRHPIRIDPADYALESRAETVTQVVDGDTFVGQGGRYRLIGIDTPEVDHQSPNRSQPGAQKAWEIVRQLIPPGSQVRVEVAKNQPALYGRQPCYLYARDPASGQELCVNKFLVEQGLARVTNFQPYHPKMQEFLESNLDAIARRKGLWNALYDPKPQPRLFSVQAEKSPGPGGGERVSFSLS
jgi:endonuclease YncB( thermonuclease family)